MQVMDWVYIAFSAVGFLGGLGVTWGAHRTRMDALRRDLDRLREEVKENHRQTEAAIKQLLILRIQNGNHREDPGLK